MSAHTDWRAQCDVLTLDQIHHQCCHRHRPTVRGLCTNSQDSPARQAFQVRTADLQAIEESQDTNTRTSRPRSFREAQYRGLEVLGRMEAQGIRDMVRNLDNRGSLDNLGT
jgi:hypothetical protein